MPFGGSPDGGSKAGQCRADGARPDTRLVQASIWDFAPTSAPTTRGCSLGLDAAQCGTLGYSTCIRVAQRGSVTDRGTFFKLLARGSSPRRPTKVPVEGCWRQRGRTRGLPLLRTPAGGRAAPCQPCHGANPSIKRAESGPTGTGARSRSSGGDQPGTLPAHHGAHFRQQERCDRCGHEPE